jgi:hypothetical protein
MCSLQGLLVQAKNGAELFVKRIIIAANGKAQACTQVAFLFFPLKLGWGWGGCEKDFLRFSLGSHVFSLCSI